MIAVVLTVAVLLLALSFLLSCSCFSLLLCLFLGRLLLFLQSLLLCLDDVLLRRHVLHLVIGHNAKVVHEGREAWPYNDGIDLTCLRQMDLVSAPTG